ncbi:phage virion morphogenesis protein [Undibacterium sp. Xuan67W]|uniref:phage virion morphogenesis protein n=1 Tax=Undibacterium sp. Xuan67W TaxID=3413057 RepID=UPI003BF0A912
MLEITFNDGGAQAALNRLIATTSNTKPAMLEIGERLMEVSKRSFETSSSPSGVPWLPNSQTTIVRFLDQLKGNYKKDGSLSKKGEQRASGKKPLIGNSKDLSRQFSYVADAGSVTLSNSMVYAAMQQFGGSKKQFPNLWGDIPARPFMPMDASGQADQVAQKIVMDIVQFHIANAITD